MPQPTGNTLPMRFLLVAAGESVASDGLLRIGTKLSTGTSPDGYPANLGAAAAESLLITPAGLTSTCQSSQAKVTAHLVKCAAKSVKRNFLLS